MQTVRDNVGAVATCNYEARKLKIKSGMSLTLAKKLANNDTFFINADRDYYKQVSDSIFDILDKYSENVEQVSIDEAYFDLSNYNNFEKAIQICNNLKNQIFSQTGITCSIGISINKLIAKMSSVEKKPNGLFVVKENEIDSFLDKKKIRDLHGVGPKSGKIFNSLGVNLVSEIKKISKEDLIKNFGNAKGTQFYEFARGIDLREINSNREKKQISRLMTLKKDTLDFEEINNTVYFLCDRVFKESQDVKKKFKTVSVILIDAKNNTITKSITLQNEIESVDQLKGIVSSLLESLIKESMINFKRAGVRISNFNDDYGYQKKLFDF